MNSLHVSDNSGDLYSSIYDHYSRNTVNGSIIREAFNLFYEIEKLTNENKLNLQLATLDGVQKAVPVTAFEQVTNVNRYATSKNCSPLIT